MHTQGGCPKWRTLVAWLEYGLADGEMTRVSRHVYHCRGCWARLSFIDQVAQTLAMTDRTFPELDL